MSEYRHDVGNDVKFVFDYRGTVTSILLVTARHGSIPTTSGCTRCRWLSQRTCLRNGTRKNSGSKIIVSTFSWMAPVAYIFGFQRLFQSCGPAREEAEALQQPRKSNQTLSAQRTEALESGSVSLEPDSRKKLRRWSHTPFGALKV